MARKDRFFSSVYHVILKKLSGRVKHRMKVLPDCGEARFFDNDNGFPEAAECVNGELLLKGERRPAWIREPARYSGK